MNASRRCGAPLGRDNGHGGRCWRPVTHDGDRCHLHPRFVARTAAGTVSVDLLDDARVSIAGGRATLRLRIRDALEVAKAIQRAVFDAESVAIEHDFDTETAPNEAKNDTERG